MSLIASDAIPGFVLGLILAVVVNLALMAAWRRLRLVTLHGTLGELRDALLSHYAWRAEQERKLVPDLPNGARIGEMASDIERHASRLVALVDQEQKDEAALSLEVRRLHGKTRLLRT